MFFNNFNAFVILQSLPSKNSTLAARFQYRLIRNKSGTKLSTLIGYFAWPIKSPPPVQLLIINNTNNRKVFTIVQRSSKPSSPSGNHRVREAMADQLHENLFLDL